MSLVWLITGSSSGFGADLARTLLKRGEKVIATGRNIAALQDLQAEGASILQLDVTAPLDELKIIAEKAVSTYGRVDVVVNNAGYFEIGALEEATPEETYHQFNVNVFGGINVARAFLPYQREQKSGTIVWVGSVAGWRGGIAGGLYAATKHAIRAISESLDEETAPFGVRSLCLEPGYFRTSFLQGAKIPVYESRIKGYEPTIAPRFELFRSIDGKQVGDPQKFAEVMVDYVRREGGFKDAGDDYPISLPIGSDSYGMVKAKLDAQMAKMDRWKEVMSSTDLPK